MWRTGIVRDRGAMRAWRIVLGSHHSMAGAVACRSPDFLRVAGVRCAPASRRHPTGAPTARLRRPDRRRPNFTASTFCVRQGDERLRGWVPHGTSCRCDGIRAAAVVAVYQALFAVRSRTIGAADYRGIARPVLAPALCGPGYSRSRDLGSASRRRMMVARDQRPDGP